MIINKTQEIARANGINTPRELAARLNVASGTAYNLWRGNTERIDLPILEKICREFKVTPGDVLVTVEDSGRNINVPGLVAA